MSKLRKIHFVIHNQGPRAPTKKDDLLALLKNKYGDNLEGYLIAQEIYTHDPKDTHLQGNLFFKNAIHFKAILKLIQSKYKETRTDLGLKGRTDLSAVLHEGRAYNYMMNSSKEGGDPDAISDSTLLDKRRAAIVFDRVLIDLIWQTHLMLDRRTYDNIVWSDTNEYHPYEPPTRDLRNYHI